MTTRKSLIFLAITFAVSWGVALGGHFSGLKDSLGAYGPTLLLVGMMTGPAIAALICAIAFEKGRRVEALGLKFTPNIWWLWAWLAPLAIAAASVIVAVIVGGQHYADIGAGVRMAASAQGQDISEIPPALLSTPVIVGLAVTLGALINAPILTFTEELGWRGYLHDLWRPAGFWRAALGTGFVWGLWHAPAILFYGLNYPANPELGVGLFIVFCMLLSPIMTLVRERAGSVWAAGLFHGAFNAVGGLTIAMLGAPAFPWNGVVGIGGFVALALGVAIVALMRRGAEAGHGKEGALPSA
jgi:membrane protease YdiL (CAAX protease family)